MSDFLSRLATHLLLASSALGIALVCGTALGIAAHDTAALRRVILGSVATLRVIPSLAVLMLIIPWLGIGTRPAIIALSLLAIAPIAIAVEAGLRSVPAAVEEAARAMGMDERMVRRRIAWPLAMPVAFGGVRTAAVETIASATLAAFVGGGGLGEFVIDGLANEDTFRLLEGGVSIALLAWSVDALLGVAARALARRYE